MNEMLTLAGAVTAIAAAFGVLWKVYCKAEAVIEGIRCQLRTEMLRTYYRHKDENKIRQYEKENFEHNFSAYKALNGNSFIDDIHNEVKKWEVCP